MKRIKRNEAPDEKARVYARVRIGSPTSEFCFSKKIKKEKNIGKIEKEEKRQKPVIRGSTIRQKNSNYRARSRNHSRIECR